MWPSATRNHPNHYPLGHFRPWAAPGSPHVGPPLRWPCLPAGSFPPHIDTGETSSEDSWPSSVVEICLIAKVEIPPVTSRYLHQERTISHKKWPKKTSMHWLAVATGNHPPQPPQDFFPLTADPTKDNRIQHSFQQRACTTLSWYSTCPETMMSPSTPFSFSKRARLLQEMHKNSLWHLATYATFNFIMFLAI